MSNSATAKTSTTASSSNSASEPVSDQRIVDIPAHPDVEKYPPSRGSPIEIVACGALAGHIRQIAARRGWQVTVRPLPAALHNRPQHIKSNVEQAIKAAQASGTTAVIAYADCGTYGALDDLAAEVGVSRLPGLHCYDLYVGAAQAERLFAEEPGTYLLTDYLIRSWERSVIEPLGLDRYPELWADYFGHYKRLVWLAQEATTDLGEKATRIARKFNLPLTCVPTGTKQLEEALAPLIEHGHDFQAREHHPQ